MPKVLLDLRMTRGRLHGIARYALELAQALPLVAPPGWEVEGLVGPQGLPADLGSLTPNIRLLKSRSEFLSLGEQLDLPGTINGSGCDLFHATSFSLPAFWSGPLVATLHDANHLDRPNEYGWRHGVYFATVVAPRAQTARALLTVSDFSRLRLSHHLQIPAVSFRVVHPGVDARFSEPSPPLASAASLPPTYFLAVGNEKPFKNLALLARIAPSLPAPIVLLAGKGAADKLGFPNTTIDLGEASEAELPRLYRRALALLLPSRYEGFGLPALEAMASGCPVIAARAGALPEVLGETGMLVDPDDDAAWLAAAKAVANGPELQSRLAAGGRARAVSFTWAACARKTWETYQAALEVRA